LARESRDYLRAVRRNADCQQLELVAHGQAIGHHHHGHNRPARHCGDLLRRRVDLFRFRLVRLLRAILDEQVRVPREIKLINWMPLILILPLFAKLYYSTWYSADDMVTTNTCGYGSEHSTLLAVLAGILIIVFQAFMNLNTFRQYGPPRGTTPAPVPVAPPPTVRRARYFSPLS